LYVTTAPSFIPNTALYRDLRYQPPQPTELTRTAGHVVRDFLRAAQSRHLRVFLQVQAAIPPGYRVQFGGPVDDDLPRMPNGREPAKRLAKNASLASPQVRGYLAALFRDLVREYPDVDGFRIDWPESPPYFVGDALVDFSYHARVAATRLGFDFTNMRETMQALQLKLYGGLTDSDVRAWNEAGGFFGMVRQLTRYPEVGAWLDFKAALAADFLREARLALDSATPTGDRYELIPNCFAPPMTLFSGFDFHRMAPYADGASVKLYTMHWPMMVNFWARELLDANPRMKDEAELVRALVDLFDIPADGGGPQPPLDLKTYVYPGPDAPHPVGDAALRRKLLQARGESVGEMPIYALAHGYGPVDDFRRRLAVAWENSDGVWINRYGYLSDAKLAAAGEVCR
jgi:hypothetical protein